MNKEEILECLRHPIGNDDDFDESNDFDVAFMDGYDDAIGYAIKLVRELDCPSIQKTSSTEIKKFLSHAGYADLAYNERVLNGIEAVLIQLGYEVKDD